MKPEMNQVYEGLRTFAEQAIKRLEQSTQEVETNLSGLSDGLRDAYDTGHLLRTVADHGVEVPLDLIDAVERLVRATLEAQPLLLRRALDNLNEDEKVDPPATAEWVNALCSRANHASMELHRGLEGIYRNAAEVGGER